jgi:hypothetical protein
MMIKIYKTKKTCPAKVGGTSPLNLFCMIKCLTLRKPLLFYIYINLYSQSNHIL